MEPGGDVIAELAADHRELEDLFSQIELQPVDHPRRRELADRLTAELVRHTVAEERHLYPAVREHVPHGAALADKELADHARVEQMLRDLEDLSVGDPQFNDTIAKLKLEVASHVREEEHELFPKLAAAILPEELDELGRLVRRARETAPTRPYPLLPNLPPANRILVPGAGLVDRVRELLRITAR
ncbi:hemerythrin domain-containing protein [Streptomyces sp. NBC_00378]|uniref:hemerythrin domain-containing protein n=1 Tax=unclassified Streptomyces TaxID=2593676 RepID=UPI002258AAAC|nr:MULTISPECIES: hemerythrin domain-containing protein [unclassified Streptomyces]MCX5115375.1 hemerythrin domain-containing protein [Streptomyces sp. NBC_00378]